MKFPRKRRRVDTQRSGHAQDLVGVHGDEVVGVHHGMDETVEHDSQVAARNRRTSVSSLPQVTKHFLQLVQGKGARARAHTVCVCVRARGRACVCMCMCVAPNGHAYISHSQE